MILVPVHEARPLPVAPAVFVRPRPPVPQPRDMALLVPAERRRMLQLARPRDRAGFAAGRALLRSVAGARLGCHPLDVPLNAAPGHQPHIAGSALACSVAHGGDALVVAVAEGSAVGVDVERLDAGLPADEAAWVAEHVLGVGKQAAAALARPAASPHEFLARWSLTEAVLKALGVGFAADASEVRLDLHPEPRLLAAPRVPPGEASRWRLDLLQPMAGHLVAVASSTDAGPPRVARLA